jgi:hypothetical protein
MTRGLFSLALEGEGCGVGVQNLSAFRVHILLNDIELMFIGQELHEVFVLRVATHGFHQMSNRYVQGAPFGCGAASVVHCLSFHLRKKKTMKFIFM